MLLAGIPARAARREPEERVPTDLLGMNMFAEQYNRYVTALQGGVIDVKQWARVVKEWGRVAG